MQLCIGSETRKPSWRWQTRATLKHAKIARIRRVSFHFTEFHFAEFERIAVQGNPRSSILVPIESPYVTSY